MKSSVVKVLLTASALLVATPSMQAWSLKRAVKYTASAAFLASILKYNFTKPNNNPVRYNLEELLAGKKLSHNVKYAVIDGLIGHGEEKAKIVVDKDGVVKLDESQKAKPKGVYGHIACTYLTPVLKSLAFIGTLNEIKKLVRRGLNDWNSFSLEELTCI